MPPQDDEKFNIEETIRSVFSFLADETGDSRKRMTREPFLKYLQGSLSQSNKNILVSNLKWYIKTTEGEDIGEDLKNILDLVTKPDNRNFDSVFVDSLNDVLPVASAPSVSMTTIDLIKRFQADQTARREDAIQLINKSIQILRAGIYRLETTNEVKHLTAEYQDYLVNSLIHAFQGIEPDDVSLINREIRSLGPINNKTLLSHAVALNKVRALERMLCCKLPIDEKNTDGSTALMEAVLLGSRNALKVLIDNGANLEIRNNDDMTALYLAASARQEILSLLLDAGAQINIHCGISNDTPMNQALINSEPENAALFLRHNVNINLQGANGETPLIVAVRCGEVSNAFINDLLANGASLEVRDNQGKTAIDHALAKKRADLLLMFNRPDLITPDMTTTEISQSEIMAADALTYLQRRGRRNGITGFR